MVDPQQMVSFKAKSMFYYLGMNMIIRSCIYIILYIFIDIYMLYIYDMYMIYMIYIYMIYIYDIYIYDIYIYMIYIYDIYI
jgi:hypothetical protein